MGNTGRKGYGEYGEHILVIRRLFLLGQRGAKPLKVTEEGHSVIIAEYQPQFLPASSPPPRLYCFNHVIKKERAWALGAYHVKGCSFGGTLVKGYPKPRDQRMTTVRADAHSLQP